MAEPIKRRASMRNFGMTSFKFNRWSVELPEEHSLEDALEPSFWVDIAGQVIGHDPANPKGRGDVIEVRKLDTGLYAELIITEVGRGFLKVRQLLRDQPDVPEVAENSPLIVKWNPGRKCHEVKRAADGQLMQSGFQTKANAIAWIEDHLNKMAA